MAERWYL